MTPGVCRTGSASSAGGDPDDLGSATPASKRRRHAAFSEDEGESRRLPSLATSASTPPTGRPKAKAAAEKPIGGRKARASEDILANRAAGSPEDEAGVAGSRRQVEMLKARSDLAKDSKALLDEVTSNRTPLGVLKKCVDGMRDEQLALLEMDPKATLDAFSTDVLAPLQALNSKMARLPLREVQDVRV